MNTINKITILHYVEDYIESREELERLIKNKHDSLKFEVTDNIKPDAINIKKTNNCGYYSYGERYYEEEYQYQNDFSVYNDLVTFKIYFNDVELFTLKNKQFRVLAHYDENKKVDGLLIKEFLQRKYLLSNINRE